MNELDDVLWSTLQPLLRALAKRIEATDSSVHCAVGSSSNDAFVLRGYLSARKSVDGEEISVTVDAARRVGAIALSVDVCMDDGEVLSEGPAALLRLSAMPFERKGELANWVGRFQDFLLEVEPLIKQRISAL